MASDDLPVLDDLTVRLRAIADRMRPGKDGPPLFLSHERAALQDAADEIERLRAAHQEREADARRLAEVALEVLHAIESGPMQSIGAVNNTFAPQIGRAQVKRWRAALEWATPAAIDAAMAPADTQEEGESDGPR